MLNLSSYFCRDTVNAVLRENESANSGIFASYFGINFGISEAVHLPLFLYSALDHDLTVELSLPHSGPNH